MATRAPPRLGDVFGVRRRRQLDRLDLHRLDPAQRALLLLAALGYRRGWLAARSIGISVPAAGAVQPAAAPAVGDAERPAAAVPAGAVTAAVAAPLWTVRGELRVGCAGRGWMGFLKAEADAAANAVA